MHLHEILKDLEGGGLAAHESTCMVVPVPVCSPVVLGMNAVIFHALLIIGVQRV